MTNGEIYFLYQEDLTEEKDSIFRVNGPRGNTKYRHTIIRYIPDENAFHTLALETDSSKFLTHICVSENTLYHYFLAERNMEQEEIILTIFSASESTFLKEAVLQYQILHPNIRMNYKFAAHDEPKDRQEMDILLKQVNAEIVSEQAADIYILDEMINGYHTENGTFVVTLFFRADCFVCKKEIKPYVESLAAFAEYLKENPKEEESGDGERLIQILDQAFVPRGYASSLTDSVYGILVQGIDGYFEGEKTLEKTVDELYSRISIKQSEEK